jgi:hypothetical protein
MKHESAGGAVVVFQAVVVVVEALRQGRKGHKYR